MVLRRFIVLILLLAAAWPRAVSAQDEEEAVTFPLENFYAKINKRPRTILQNIKFGLSTGYGSTFFSHDLSGFGVYQAPGGTPNIFLSPSTASRYSNWVNQSVNDNSAAVPGSFLVSSDTARIGFKGSAMNIPLKLTIHYEFGGRYRIGGGYSFEYMSIGSMRPTAYADKIRDFQPTQPSGFMSKYFGLVGVSFYRAGDYLFTGDLQVGGFSPGSNFNASLIQAGVYVNLGVTIERELSEYLRLFVRPSFDIKSYTLTLPEGGPAITHQMNAFYLSVGVSYSIPELPKCFIPDCKIQMNHAHGNREYRSRVHPIYKKQNPQYGENHPNLIKYKGKNKRKMNPY